LRALECVKEDPLAAAHRPALEQRFMRARFDAAFSLISRRRYREAIPYWWAAIRSSGSLLRKCKSSMRLALTALMSAQPSARGPSAKQPGPKSAP